MDNVIKKFHVFLPIFLDDCFGKMIDLLLSKRGELANLLKDSGINWHYLPYNAGRFLQYWLVENGNI